MSPIPNIVEVFRLGLFLNRERINLYEMQLQKRRLFEEMRLADPLVSIAAMDEEWLRVRQIKWLVAD